MQIVSWSVTAYFLDKNIYTYKITMSSSEILARVLSVKDILEIHNKSKSEDSRIDFIETV